MVESGNKAELARREVERLVGVSQYKQAFSTGDKYKLLVRNHACCCTQCLLGEFESCDIKDYTAIPKAVSFTPKVVPTPSLRSTDVQNQLDNEIVNSEQTVETDAIEFVTEPGKIYVVLGDSIEGYYFVKCLLSSSDSFKGKYLSVCCGEGGSETIVLKENRETDCFEYESVVSEVFCVTEVNAKKMFVINKEQLNDILVTIGEMVDI